MPRTRWLWALLALGLEAIGPGARGAAAPPFDVAPRRITGRPVDGAHWQGWLAIASVRGSPPDEERWLTIFPPGAPERPPEPTVIPIESAVVAFDLAELEAGAGPELLLLQARGLRVLSAARGETLYSLGWSAPLPLPPRTRQLSHLSMVSPSSPTVPREILVPGRTGLRRVRKAARAPRISRLPLVAEYETREGADRWTEGWLTARLVWPHLDWADDDGDGRLDLFALGRFRLEVFRTGDGGLPARATRSAALPRFSEQEEERHRTTTLRAFARDLDGDGRADLVVHRSVGGLLDSHATTSVFHNPGNGADPSDPASAQLVSEGGFAGISLVDIEADGRVELLQTRVAYGLSQLIRVLSLRRLEAALHLFRLDARAPGGLRETWSTRLRYAVDLREGRLRGLLPSTEGDWNGDGLRDLVHAAGAKRIAIRLGRVTRGEPGFGSVVASQPVPAFERSLVLDADQDGLDDLILWDSLDPKGRVWLLHNRGLLPGTAPHLRGAP